jgi:hypothetical protein
MYILFWSLRLSLVITRFGLAESEFKSRAEMMRPLSDNGFNGGSSDEDDKTSRIDLMRCAASLGAFAAGCGRESCCPAKGHFSLWREAHSLRNVIHCK